MVQTDLTTVRVSWTPPKYPVTEYRVKYFLANETGRSENTTLSADIANTEITGLTNGETYIVSVEATSNSLSVVSGVSNALTLKLGMIVLHISTLLNNTKEYNISSIYNDTLLTDAHDGDDDDDVSDVTVSIVIGVLLAILTSISAISILVVVIIRCHKERQRCQRENDRYNDVLKNNISSLIVKLTRDKLLRLHIT